MTPAAFRKLALSMPGAYEAPHFNRTAFRTKKRIFATMTQDGRQAMIPVLPVELCYAMLKKDPDVFIDHGGFTRAFGSLGMWLSKVKLALVEPMMRAAWERASPRMSRAASGRGSRVGSKARYSPR
jgi:hypothetical protein